MLSREQVEFYKDHGFLHIPAVFSDTETDELATELDWLMETCRSPMPVGSGRGVRRTWMRRRKRNRS